MKIKEKTEKQNTWDWTFIDIAHVISEHSTCAKKQVGAVLVKDRRILSTGYNGVPSGVKPHCNEIFNISKFRDSNKGLRDYWLSEHRIFQKANEVHAEINCLLYAAKHGISAEGGTMYLTLSPCVDCAKAMIVAGIKKIIYYEDYDGETGLELLKKAKIECKKI